MNPSLPILFRPEFLSPFPHFHIPRTNVMQGAVQNGAGRGEGCSTTRHCRGRRIPPRTCAGPVLPVEAELPTSPRIHAGHTSATCRYCAGRRQISPRARNRRRCVLVSSCPSPPVAAAVPAIRSVCPPSRAGSPAGPPPRAPPAARRAPRRAARRQAGKDQLAENVSDAARCAPPQGGPLSWRLGPSSPAGPRQALSKPPPPFPPVASLPHIHSSCPGGVTAVAAS